MTDLCNKTLNGIKIKRLFVKELNSFTIISFISFKLFRGDMNLEQNDSLAFCNIMKIGLSSKLHDLSCWVPAQQCTLMTSLIFKNQLQYSDQTHFHASFLQRREEVV